MKKRMCQINRRKFLIVSCLILLVASLVGFLLYASFSLPKTKRIYMFQAYFLRKGKRVYPSPFYRRPLIYYIHPGKNYTGPWRIWDGNGTIREYCEFKNGIIDGKYKRWDAHGNLEYRRTYSHGKLDGEYFEYSPDGKIISKKLYKNGEEIMCSEPSKATEPESEK